MERETESDGFGAVQPMSCVLLFGILQGLQSSMKWLNRQALRRALQNLLHILGFHAQVIFIDIQLYNRNNTMQNTDTKIFLKSTFPSAPSGLFYTTILPANSI